MISYIIDSSCVVLLTVVSTGLLAAISQEDVQRFKMIVITVTQNARTKMEDAANRATIAFDKCLFVVCFIVVNDIDRPCSISIPLLTLQFLVLYIAGLTIRWGEGGLVQSFFFGGGYRVRERRTSTRENITRTYTINSSAKGKHTTVVDDVEAAITYWCF